MGWVGCPIWVASCELAVADVYRDHELMVSVCYSLLQKYMRFTWEDVLGEGGLSEVGG